jgi:NlpC/P60 family
MYFIIGVFLLLFSTPFTLHASIFGYVDEGGAYHFTNIKPANRQYQIVVETKESLHAGARGALRSWRSDDERYGLIKQAKTLLGVPYKLGGESLAGIDCSAFVKKMFSGIDVALPRTAREQYEVGRRVSRDELTTGDLVFFRTKQHEPHPTHVGIYMGNGQFIHASALKKAGVKIDSLSADFYNTRFIGASRVVTLPDESSTPVITASK